MVGHLLYHDQVQDSMSCNRFGNESVHAHISPFERKGLWSFNEMCHYHWNSFWLSSDSLYAVAESTEETDEVILWTFFFLLINISGSLSLR